MTKKSDICDILPPGAEINIDGRFRRGVIFAPPGELFNLNNLNKLYYEEPATELCVFYAGVHSDVSRGTYSALGGDRD